MNRPITQIVILLTLLVCLPVYSALPFAIDGEALPSLAPMLEKTTPAVVNIATKGLARKRLSQPLFNDPIFRRFFNIPEYKQQEIQSLGSGVIVDADNGYILTNNHVIENAYEITVTMLDGRQFSAEVLGRDKDTDIAVIKVRSDDLQALKLANSNQLRVGDFVVAIGNPFGLGQTVTSGIISALGRSGLGIESYEDFIQTDASINPGNSGGALVNLRGELIGINTAILGSGSGNTGNIGIGFAIPINMASDIMMQLIEHGEVKRGRLGAQAQNLTPELARAFNLKHHEGAVVTQIEAGSAADMAGLQVGDIIVEANGKTIRSSLDMYNFIGLIRVGSQIELTFYRAGEKRQVTATIEEIKVVRIDGVKINYRFTGAVISLLKQSDIRQGQLQYLQIFSVEVGSAAWSAGLREEDIIYSINKHRVSNFDEAYKAAQLSRSLLLNIQRGDQALYILIK